MVKSPVLPAGSCRRSNRLLRRYITQLTKKHPVFDQIKEQRYGAFPAGQELDTIELQNYEDTR